MRKARPLTEIKAYAAFTGDLDRALQKILHVHLSAIDMVLGKLKRKTVAFTHLSPGMVSREFSLAAVQIAVLASRLRKEAYLLSHVGQASALAQVFSRTHKVAPKADHGEMPSGGNLDDRILLFMSRLKHKVDDALQLSKVLGDSVEDTRLRLIRAFPPSRPRPQTTRALTSRRLTEAEGRGTRGRNFTAGFVDEETWNDILSDYFAKDLPEDIFARGPDDRVLFFDLDSGEQEVRYSWEVEQEITEDFVRQVRAGEQDAANQNGINDFLWNAVIDSHTDECCSVRDGLSSTEIESAIEDGTIDEDECDAIVAPAHFNCRCKSVPMSEDLPDQAPADFEGFDDWLGNKAKDT